MDLAPDPLFLQVRTALRAALVAIPPRPEMHGAPVTDGFASPARGVLEELGVADFERPAPAGGLDLGLTAGVLVSEELGRAACGNPYRAEAMAADVGCPRPESVAGVALAGLEALPAGRGVTATRRGDGWQLTGTATADDAQAALFLVAVATSVGRRSPSADKAVVAVPRDAPGVSVQTTCWPPVLRFQATPVASADVLAPTGDALADPLARARLRQAAYLLGIAEGAHRIALDHTGFRRQFGSRLRDLPAVSFPVARALVALRATRAVVYRAAWMIDAEPDTVGTEPVMALAMAAETARDVVRLSMQSCGVRAMTAELGLHRYFRLAAAESARYGDPAALWRMVGADRLRTAVEDQETEDRRFAVL
jgi:alkylation response protein AidB-like acyl-CoA dehydrogenase